LGELEKLVLKVHAEIKLAVLREGLADLRICVDDTVFVSKGLAFLQRLKDVLLLVSEFGAEGLLGLSEHVYGLEVAVVGFCVDAGVHFGL
jgi:hypothetical protein